MFRPRPFLLGFATLGLFAAALGPVAARADDPPAADAGAVPSRFVRVVDPISTDDVAQIRKAVQAFVESESGAREKGVVPIVVFEFLPGDSAEKTTPGGAVDLADFLLDEVDHARVRTVAFVPEGLSGYAVLPALSCDEIAMPQGAVLGPITPERDTVRDTARALVQKIAAKNGREAELGLMLGMLDRSLDIRRVKTDKGVRFVPASELDGLRQSTTVEDESPVWEAGNRGKVTTETGGSLVKIQAANPGEVRRAYNLQSTAYAVAPEADSGELNISGPISRGAADFAQQYLRDQAAKGTKRIFVRVSSLGGDTEAARRIAYELLSLQDVQTIAYIEDQASGGAALIPLACQEIVFQRGARLGDITAGRGGENLAPSVLADTAEEIAKRRGHSPALARAMADAQAEVLLVRDRDSKAVIPILKSEFQNGKHTDAQEIKGPGEPLVLTADRALSLGLAASVVGSDAEMYRSYGLDGRPKGAKPTWVHSLITTLNDPWMSGLLLFVGLFMLILELKLPGVGLPAIISALAFLLFFWSHYLGGTADQLEILLFLVGVVCLALELFVFPGFAVFGLSGILLILASVIMASHTFVWPTNNYEYQQMGRTLMEVTAAIVFVSVGAIVLGRYFPSLPLFRRMILVPEPAGRQFDEVTGKPIDDGEVTYFHLLGEVGRTTTPLKPTGRARFGETLADVIADGFYIEQGAPVEVVEVQGSKVIVKRASGGVSEEFAS